MTTVTDLWLVRHGHSEHHDPKRLQWPDAALSEEGQWQAERLALRFCSVEGVAALYSSPLRRARDTACPIGSALGMEPVLHPGLREIDFGQAGGLTADEFQGRWAELVPLWEDIFNLSFRWPGGESRGEFQQRAVVAMEGLAQIHRGQRVIVVAHTGPLCCYLAHLLLGDAARWREVDLRPAAISRVAVGPAGARPLLWDDDSHLQNEEGTRV